eukprot:TRINITY_DN13718_c0_g1_i2.p2 TRINITY_DN13718_c0_g1~~TRINITY_DN13718_c0_g1_i2.p2  ORF type:complete len:107 (-),score=22.35 TRINITY_DN13718_c0_g1_i2:17-337(-)
MCIRDRHMTKQQKERIEAEGKPLLKAAEKCKTLWNSLMKADFRGEGRLNEANINLVFEQNRGIIEDLLKVTKSADFLEIFDQDKDCLLYTSPSPRDLSTSRMPSSA